VRTQIPSRIAIPSGYCPHRLEGTDVESVGKWVKKLRDQSPAGTEYMPTAFRYWIRHTYDINGPEYPHAVESLEKFFGHKIVMIIERSGSEQEE
tara:strand:- start:277 stop:558 length:282 start_codon:yes stop_codon:yes gene_type:complete